MIFNNQQKRIDNIRNAEGANKEYLIRRRCFDYLPGQAIYNLGEYPVKVNSKPTDYDKNLVKDLAESGVKLIQLHEDWNDACRLYGADKFNAVDEDGIKEFIALCHSYDIKVIAYMSTCYFPEPDQDFREEFHKRDSRLAMNYFNYRHCNHGSASWREYVMNRSIEAMDKYGFDGIFNDVWHDRVVYDYEKGECVQLDPADSVEYDPDFEDMICQIYSEVKKRGGIYKLHMSGKNNAPAKDKVYDYMWVGEGLTDVEPGIGKDFSGYTVPCLDRHFYDGVDAKTYFAYTIPFMQFPLLKTGRPMIGEGVGLPNVTYYGGDEEEFFWDVKKYAEENPDSPPIYSLWDSIPNDSTEYDAWKYYMKYYAPMTKENSLAYVEIRKSDEILSEIPQRVYASMFVNDETYFAVSNLTGEKYTLKLKGMWKNRETGEISDSFDIENESLLLLVKM